MKKTDIKILVGCECSDAYNLPKRERAKIRSRTFPSIAQAMAKQWGEYLEQKFLINQ
jgi:hypothetical protein